MKRFFNFSVLNSLVSLFVFFIICLFAFSFCCQACPINSYPTHNPNVYNIEYCKEYYDSKLIHSIKTDDDYIIYSFHLGCNQYEGKSIYKYTDPEYAINETSNTNYSIKSILKYVYDNEYFDATYYIEFQNVSSNGHNIIATDITIDENGDFFFTKEDTYAQSNNNIYYNNVMDGFVHIAVKKGEQIKPILTGELTNTPWIYLRNDFKDNDFIYEILDKLSDSWIANIYNNIFE